jgi:DNA polymerase I-like protein with 3'-5' exonuclease and polymerase domains
LASPKQGDVLFDSKKLAELNKRKQNWQYATGEEVLTIWPMTTIVKDILNWRQLIKSHKTLMWMLYQTKLDQITGRIYIRIICKPCSRNGSFEFE